jgi:hypothetical protein
MTISMKICIDGLIAHIITYLGTLLFVIILEDSTALLSCGAGAPVDFQFETEKGREKIPMMGLWML